MLFQKKKTKKILILKYTLENTHFGQILETKNYEKKEIRIPKKLKKIRILKSTLENTYSEKNQNYLYTEINRREFVI